MDGKVVMTMEQLRRIIREVIEVHMAPDDLEEIGPEEAYGLGYYAGKDSVETEEGDEALSEFDIHEGLLRESMMRHAEIWLSSDGTWYMDLANNEYGEYEDSDTHGPFYDNEAAEEYLRNNFSNPGGVYTDDSGTRPTPTTSPNGRPVQSPRQRSLYGSWWR